MNYDRLNERLTNIGWGIVLVLALGFWAAVAVVAVHFIRKFW